jgi:hypothetical protein
MIPFRVMASATSRTVDIVRAIAPGREGGAYIRVMPHPRAGSVINMTIPVSPDGDSDHTRAVLHDELSGLKQLAVKPKSRLGLR